MSGALDHSPADVLRRLLIDLGHGTDPTDGSAWPMYVAREPDEPDNAITLFDTTSVHYGRHQYDGEVQEAYGVQIRIRAVDHPTGYVKANDLAIAVDQEVLLDTIAVPNVSGTGYTSYVVWNVSRASGPLALGKDMPVGKRNVFTINVLVTLQQAT